MQFLGVLLTTLVLAAPLAAQTAGQRTIFTTPNFRQDRDLWTDPAYYRNNTVAQLRGMAIGTEPSGGTGQAAASRVYGSEGTGKVGALELDPETRPELRPLYNTCTDHERTVREGPHGRAGAAQRAPAGRSAVLGFHGFASVANLSERKRPEVRAVPEVAAPLRGEP